MSFFNSLQEYVSGLNLSPKRFSLTKQEASTCSTSPLKSASLEMKSSLEVKTFQRQSSFRGSCRRKKQRQDYWIEKVTKGYDVAFVSDVHITDKSFIESLTSLNYYRETIREAITNEEETELAKAPPDLETLLENDKLELEAAIDGTEKEKLYVEVLGLINNMSPETKDSVFTYAQHAFNIPIDKHWRLLHQTGDYYNKRVVVTVVVVEADGLEAKDANGFSDPYCMLGIRPYSSPAASPQKHHFRLSFKRREASTSSAPLPAKCIKATSVKNHTLRPKWNEKFRFTVDDINNDLLHLDIWDHDDESSVLEAVRKLNEVKGVRGLTRFFKQVAQSARQSTCDDFLGCVTIPLRDVPTGGLDRWFRLEARSWRSCVQGRIRLKMWLSCRDSLDSDNWLAVKQHQQLIQIFLLYEVNYFMNKNNYTNCNDEYAIEEKIDEKHKVNKSKSNYNECKNEIRKEKSGEKATWMWRGQLTNEAIEILHYHAVKGDLTPAQKALCWWTSAAKTHQQISLDPSFMLGLLEDVEQIWKSACFSREEEQEMAEGFNYMLDVWLQQLKYHRSMFPALHQPSLTRLSFVLECLAFLGSMKALWKCCPFNKEPRSEIVAALRNGTKIWFDELFNQCCKKDFCWESTDSAGCYANKYEHFYPSNEEDLDTKSKCPITINEDANSQNEILLKKHDRCDVNYEGALNRKDLYNEEFTQKRNDTFSGKNKNSEVKNEISVSVSTSMIDSGKRDNNISKNDGLLSKSIDFQWKKVDYVGKSLESKQTSERKCDCDCDCDCKIADKILTKTELNSKSLDLKLENFDDKLRNVDIKTNDFDTKNKHFNSRCVNWKIQVKDTCVTHTCENNGDDKNEDKNTKSQDSAAVIDNLGTKPKTCIEKNQEIKCFRKTEEKFFQQKLKSEDNEEFDENFIRFLIKINVHLQIGLKYYHPLFEEINGIPYFTIIFKQIDKLISDITLSNLPSVFRMLISMFLEIRDITLLTDQRLQLQQKVFDGFKDGVKDCIMIMKDVGKQRIQKSIEISTKHTNPAFYPHSSSSMDIHHLLSSLITFWRMLQWPRPLAAPLLTTIIDCVVTWIEEYVNKIKEDPCEDWIVKVNDLEIVAEVIETMEGTLDFAPLAPHHHSRLTSSVSLLRGYISTILQQISQQLEEPVRKAMFHLAWSPESLPTEEAIDPLMDLLNETLKEYASMIVPANFQRLLLELWLLTLSELSLQSDSSSFSPTFYLRLQQSLDLLVTFFHGDGNGLAIHTLQADDCQIVRQRLRFHQTNTDGLIEAFYEQRLKQQTTGSSGPYGTLSVRAYFNHDSLCVEVLHARDVIPLDPNGYSDPFVVVTLLPQRIFANVVPQVTQIHKKTLNPTFDEIFEFPLSLAQCMDSASMLAFTVMDHDVIGSNDFAGEAFLALNSLPGVGDTATDHFHGLKQIDLILMMLNDCKTNPILQILESRTGDKTAQEFVRKQKTHILS